MKLITFPTALMCSCGLLYGRMPDRQLCLCGKRDEFIEVQFDE